MAPTIPAPRGRGECRRCDESNGATQTRVFFRWYDMNLGSATKVSQRALAHCATHDRFDQAPRCSYLAADINAPGIESVDDRSQAQAEITRSRVNCRECFCITGTSTRN